MLLRRVSERKKETRVNYLDEEMQIKSQLIDSNCSKCPTPQLVKRAKPLATGMNTQTNK